MHLHTALDAMVHPSTYEELGTEWSWGGGGGGDTITKAYGFFYQIQFTSFLLNFNSVVSTFKSMWQGEFKKVFAETSYEW